MTHEDAQDQLALYVLGGMELQDEREMTQHVRGYALCQQDLQHYRDTVGQLDDAVIRPDWSEFAHLRSQFQERLANPPSEVNPTATIRAGSSPRAWLWPAAWVATALIAVGGWHLALATHRTLSQSQQMLALVTHGRPVALNSVHAQRADVKLYISHAQAVVFVKRLPKPSRGQVYEGWWIVRGRPRPAGTFEAGPSLLRYPARAQAFAITMEPSGGTSAPTTPVLVAGTV